LSCGFDRLSDVLIEARRFLGLAQPVPILPPRPEPPAGLPNAARRLLVMSHPLAGTIAETYLRTRGIAITPDLRALRFHPRCFYRITDDETGANRYEVWPVLLATVTDLDGKVTGVHRTWLDPSGRDKARCRRHDARWATFSGTACGSELPMTSWRRIDLLF
jgi:hypothetical protein